MSKKVTSVILQHGDIQKEFELTHAERILRMPNNGGWQLPEDSKFEITEENGLKYRTDPGTGKKAKEEKRDQ